MESNNRISAYRSIDLRDSIGVMVKRKWYLIVPFLIVFGSAIGISYLLTPEYESQTILSYGNRPSLIKQLSGLVANQSEGRMSSEDRRRLLAGMKNEITSSRVLSRLALELKLDQLPGIEKEAQRIRSEHPTLDLKKIKRDLIIERLREAISVDFAGKEQLKIGVFDPDPFMAQKMADRLTAIYVEERILQDLGAVREAQQLTDDQLSKFESQLQELVDEKTTAEKDYLKLQIDESIISEENRRTIRTAIDEIAGEISELDREEVRLLEALKGRENLTLPLSKKAKHLITELGEDSRSVVEMMGKYAWSERIVLNGTIELNRKLVELEGEIELLVNAKFAGVDNQTKKNITRYFIIKRRVEFLHSHRELLQESFAAVQRSATQIPVARARLDQLEREVKVARQNLELFRQQETSNQLRQDIIHSANSRYQVIEPATAPFEPSRPNRVKISVMGAILGLILGGAAILVAELLDASFRKVDDVERELGVPVLATIPNIDKLP